MPLAPLCKGSWIAVGKTEGLSLFGFFQIDFLYSPHKTLKMFYTKVFLEEVRGNRFLQKMVSPQTYPSIKHT